MSSSKIANLWVHIETQSSPDGTAEFTTEAMEVEQAGCLVRVSTTIYDLHTGFIVNLSEALTFVPWSKIVDRKEEDILVGKKLMGGNKF
jgi:hypothetical protein